MLPSLLWMLAGFASVEAACYFPVEFQGAFEIQTYRGGSEVAYSEVNVEADAILPLGRCHLRRGNIVILNDTTGIEDCMRCFHMILGTPNVIQLHTEGLERCYTSEEAARATCPDDYAIAEKRFKEIVMFRKSDPLNGVQDRFCPINGRYRIAYESRHQELRCDEMSEVSNCPLATGLKVDLRSCGFPDKIEFKCLGEWDSPSGLDRFIALLDTRVDTEGQPRYRCGMYRTNKTSGEILVALSADSTCTTLLTDATDGFETMVLSPLPKIANTEAKCKFPEWAQGSWNQLRINGRTMEYRDLVRKHSVIAQCVARAGGPETDKFVILNRNQCGEEAMACIEFRRRGENILEYQLGSKYSKTKSVCEDTNADDPKQNWITQGRLVNIHSQSRSSCPITGDYTGVVPGTTGLCAKFSSDCNNPDIMFYTVTSCENRSHLYEEREYRCLGNWEENGVVFTYTQRRDIDGFQCFSGKVMRDREEVYIKEAGVNCDRGEDPRVYGMKIVKQASCPQPTWLPPLPPAVRPTVRAPYWYRTHPTPRSWKPPTVRPLNANNVDVETSNAKKPAEICTAILFLVLLFIHL